MDGQPVVLNGETQPVDMVLIIIMVVIMTVSALILVVATKGLLGFVAEE